MQEAVIYRVGLEAFQYCQKNSFKSQGSFFKVKEKATVHVSLTAAFLCKAQSWEHLIVYLQQNKQYLIHWLCERGAPF